MLRDISLCLPEDDMLEVVEAIEKLHASVLRKAFSARKGTEWELAMQNRARNLAKILATVRGAYEAK